MRRLGCRSGWQLPVVSDAKNDIANGRVANGFVEFVDPMQIMQQVRILNWEASEGTSLQVLGQWEQACNGRRATPSSMAIKQSRPASGDELPITGLTPRNVQSTCHPLLERLTWLQPAGRGSSAGFRGSIVGIGTAKF
jgi:hypothetical protein